MNDKIIDKIRKMLALARDAGATEGERDNALRMAHKWIAKYNLDLASVEAGGVQEDRGAVHAGFHGIPWARTCAGSIARLFFCTYYYAKSNNSDNAKHSFVGRESNATTAMEVAKFVVTAIQREAAAWQRTRNAHYRDYRAFAAGAAKSVYTRCMVLRAEQEKESADVPAVATPGTALVLATVYQREEDANKAWETMNVPGMRTVKPRAGAIEAGAAYFRGRAYGAQVSLTPQLAGTTQKLVR